MCKSLFFRFQREPFTESSQFILIVMTSYLRIYMMAWPADDVREMVNVIDLLNCLID